MKAGRSAAAASARRTLTARDIACPVARRPFGHGTGVSFRSRLSTWHPAMSTQPNQWSPWTVCAVDPLREHLSGSSRIRLASVSCDSRESPALASACRAPIAPLPHHTGGAGAARGRLLRWHDDPDTPYPPPPRAGVLIRDAAPACYRELRNPYGDFLDAMESTPVKDKFGIICEADAHARADWKEALKEPRPVHLSALDLVHSVTHKINAIGRKTTTPIAIYIQAAAR